MNGIGASWTNRATNPCPPREPGFGRAFSCRGTAKRFRYLSSNGLVTACLLHDLGHLIADHPETPTLRGVDDKHQYFVLPFLRGLFGARVLDPIRLHVEAKRYLCYVEPEYALMLTEDSRRSLNLQGGGFDAGQAINFAALPGAPDAIRLRRWDDLAKAPTMATGSLSHFLDLASIVSERRRLIAA